MEGKDGKNMPLLMLFMSEQVIFLLLFFFYTLAAEEIPQDLIDQLRLGGRMVIFL